MPRGDDNVLLAFAHVTDRIGVDTAAGLESPQQVALLGVERKEGALIGAENQAPAGRHQAGMRRSVQFIFPAQLAGGHIERPDGAVPILVLVWPLAATVE